MRLRVTFFALLYASLMLTLIMTFRLGGLTGTENRERKASSATHTGRVEASVLFRIPGLEEEKVEPPRRTLASPATPSR